MNLLIEDESPVVDFTIEMNRQLWNAGNRLINANILDSAISQHNTSCQSEITVKPRVVQYSAVHLDANLLPTK